MDIDEHDECEALDEGIGSSRADDEALSDMEETALRVVASGLSHAVAGQTVGRSAKWVQRLLKKAEARAFVSRIRRERLDQVSGILSSSASRAAQVIEQLLESENETMRLRAAQVLLTQARDQVMVDELRLVAEQLESEVRALRDEELQD